MRLLPLLLLLSAPAMAPVRAEVRAGALVVDQAFSRATPSPAMPGAAYLRIRNTGAEPDRLVSASSPAAGQVSLHATLREGDVLRMRALTGMDVPPGGALVLSPESRLHLMLEDLRAPLRAGTTISLALQFERAGPVVVEVPVGNPGAMAAP